MAERSRKVAGEAVDAFERGGIEITGKAWDSSVKSDSKIGEYAKLPSP